MSQCTMFNPENIVVLSLTGNHDLSKKIIEEVNNLSHARLKFHHLNMGTYPDGEIDNRIIDFEELEGKQVIIFQSAYSQNLMVELLDMCWAVKYQYKAKKLVVVLPFMHYRRQDSKTLGEIDRSKWFAHNLKANGSDIVIVCDIHAQRTLQDFKDVGIDVHNTDPNRAYVSRLRLSVKLAEDDGRGYYIYVPDEGSIPRALPLAKLLGVKVAINLKKRDSSGGVKRFNDSNRIKELEDVYDVKLVVVDSDLSGASFCIREDELSTGGTAALAGEFLVNEIGAHEVFFCATHAVCANGWKRKIVDRNPFANKFLGDTIPRGYINSTGGQVTDVSVAHQMAVKIISVMHKIK